MAKRRTLGKRTRRATKKGTRRVQKRVQKRVKRTRRVRRGGGVKRWLTL